MHIMRPHFIFIICTISLLERTFAMNDGDLRLTEGNTTTGWVEIYYRSQWNRVSDEFLIYDISTVVCRQLGLPFTRAEELDNPTMPRPEAGNIQVWESLAFCDGDEARFVDCRSFRWNVAFHLHDNDVAVQCKGEYIATGDLRLADGSDQFRGRLEIFQGNHWNSFCSVGFGTTEATVACRQLGFLTNVSDAVVYPDAYFGQGNMKGAGLYTAHCNGDEERVDSCDLYPSSNSDINNERLCSHSQDVGICCPQLAGECPPESSTVGGGVIASIVVVVVIVLSIIGCCCYCCKKPKPKPEQFSAVVVRPLGPDGGAPQASMASSGITDHPPGYYHGSTPGNADTQQYPAQYPFTVMPPPVPVAAGSSPQAAPYPAGQVPPPGAYPAPHQPGYNPTAAASMQYPPKETKGVRDHPLPTSHTTTESPSARPIDISSGCDDEIPSVPPPAYEHLFS